MSEVNDRITFYICITLKNIVAIVGFCVLAYLFQHWWISLFSILCITSFPYIHNSRTYENPNKQDKSTCISERNKIQCYVCGEILLVEDIQHVVHKEIQENGWKRIHVVDGWKDICPTCAEKYYNKR